MDGVRLVLHELPASTGADRPSGPALRLAAPSVTITDITVVAGGEEIPVESVTLSAQLTEAQLTLADLDIAGTTWRLAANGTIVPVEPFGLDLHAQWTSHVDGVAQEGRLTIAGDANSLDFDAAMQAPVGLRSSGRVKRTTQGYEVAATGAWQDLRWPPFGPPAVRSPEGRFELGGALDALGLALDLDFAADHAPSTRLTVEGTGSVEPSAALPFELATRWRAVTASGTTLSGELDASGDFEHVALRPRVLSPFAASAEARLSLGDEASFEALTRWSGLFWPLTGTQVVASPEGRLEAKGTAESAELTLTMALEAPERVHDGHVSATATVSVIGAPEVTGSFGWDAKVVSHDARLRGAGTVRGNPSGALRFTHALSAPFAVSSTGEVTMTDPAPGLRMMSEWVDLRWPTDGPEALSSPRGTLEVQGWLDDFRAVLKAGFDAAGGAGELRVEARGGAIAEDRHVDIEWRASVADGRAFAGRGRVGGGTGQARVTHVLTAPFELSTGGVVDSPVAAPELRLAGTWRDLHWPPDRSARYRSAGGTYTLNGPLDALEVRLDGTLDADGLPSAQVTLTGMLDDTGLDLEPALIEALGGRTTARGRVGWHPGIDWNLEVDAHGIDPGRQWPQWNGTLDAAAVVQGRMVDGAPHATVDVHQLQGRLRGYPVDGRGIVATDGERLRARDVSLRSGDNLLALEGVYHREMDLELSLDAPDLSAVLPDAEGRLAGEGVLRGSTASPYLKMRLEGRDMRYRDWAARRVEIDAEVSNSQSTSQVVMQVGDARAGEHRIESVELRADGTLAAHTAHATVTSSLGDLDLRLEGGMEAGRWLGELVDTTAIASGGSTWRLEGASELGVDTDRIIDRDDLHEVRHGGRCLRGLRPHGSLSVPVRHRLAPALGAAAVAAGRVRPDRRAGRRGCVVARRRPSRRQRRGQRVSRRADGVAGSGRTARGGACRHRAECQGRGEPCRGRFPLGARWRWTGAGPPARGGSGSGSLARRHDRGIVAATRSDRGLRRRTPRGRGRGVHRDTNRRHHRRTPRARRRAHRSRSRANPRSRHRAVRLAGGGTCGRRATGRHRRCAAFGRRTPEHRRVGSARGGGRVDRERARPHRRVVRDRAPPRSRRDRVPGRHGRRGGRNARDERAGGGSVGPDHAAGQHRRCRRGVRRRGAGRSDRDRRAARIPTRTGPRRRPGGRARRRCGLRRLRTAFAADRRDPGSDVRREACRRHSEHSTSWKVSSCSMASGWTSSTDA